MTKTRRQREIEAQQPQQVENNESAMKQAIVSFAGRFLQLPRLVRIVLVAMFALGWVLALFPLIDGIYIDYFFDMETRQWPAYISAGIGLMIYMIGWYLLIGTVGRAPKPKLINGLFLCLCIGALVFVATLMIHGIMLQIID